MADSAYLFQRDTSSAQPDWGPVLTNCTLSRWLDGIDCPDGDTGQLVIRSCDDRHDAAHSAGQHYTLDKERHSSEILHSAEAEIVDEIGQAHTLSEVIRSFGTESYFIARLSTHLQQTWRS